LHQRQYWHMKMMRRRNPEMRVAAPRPANSLFSSSFRLPMQEPVGLPSSTLLVK